MENDLASVPFLVDIGYQREGYQMLLSVSLESEKNEFACVGGCYGILAEGMAELCGSQ